MKRTTALISACLLGIPCQYNGQVAKICLQDSEIEALKYHLVPVCPEQLSGLPTPRKPVEIQGGDGLDVLSGTARVISEDGEDFTEQFIQGAKNVLTIARLVKADKMITQFRSPSCSCHKIYDGTFSHTLHNGMGVCAALLHKKNILLLDIEIVKTKQGKILE